MKSGFLYHVAQDLTLKFRNDFKDVTLIFPGKRSIIFFKKYLSEIIKEDVFIPNMLTMDEYIKSKSQNHCADPLELLFELFQSYLTISKKTESFDEFYQWGEMLLGDFSDIDKYLIPANDIFVNLSDLKKIDTGFDYMTDDQLKVIQKFWQHIDPKKGSTHKEAFLSIWNLLLPVYDHFIKKLQKNNIAYDGLIYKEVAQAFKNGKIEHKKEEMVCFIGLNVLTQAEIEILNYFKNNKQGKFYWEYDESYLNNPYHEAGKFLRKNLQYFPQEEFTYTHQNFIKKKKKVEVISCASNSAQPQILSTLLETESVNENTCIVLADESLLIPLLHALPDHLKHVNITMGYPLQHASVYHFILTIFELQAGIKTKSSKQLYYYKPVLALLKHTYLNIDELEGNLLSNLIIEKRYLYVPEALLCKNELFKIVFQKIENGESWLQYLIKLLQTILKLYDHVNLNDHMKLDRQFAVECLSKLQNLSTILKHQSTLLSTSIMQKIIKRVLEQTEVSFIGEPLQGLQIMGMLESRNLSFEKVILLSANEGILPKKSTPFTFIPHSLRLAFDLPTYLHQDAIYAYYFYRLLQDASQVHITYNANTEDLKSGEVSRYIHQLKYESHLSIEFKNLVTEISGNLNKSQVIIKDMNTMNWFTFNFNSDSSYYLSPSAFNTYLNCPIQFYYKYIKGIREVDTPHEDMDALLFGNTFHLSMQKLLQPYVNKTLTKEVMQEIMKEKEKILSIIEEALWEIENGERNFKTDVYVRAKALLIDIIYHYVYATLSFDLKRTPFTLKGLEIDLKREISIVSNENTYNLKIGGTIDRLQEKDGYLEIIDYKTGKAQLEFKTVDSIIEPSKDRPEAIMQTLFYALLVESNQRKRPLIYSITDISTPQFNGKIKLKENRSSLTIEDISPYLKDFEDLLKCKLTELTNKDIPFNPSSFEHYCDFCES